MGVKNKLQESEETDGIQMDEQLMPRSQATYGRNEKSGEQHVRSMQWFHEQEEVMGVKNKLQESEETDRIQMDEQLMPKSQATN